MGMAAAIIGWGYRWSDRCGLSSGRLIVAGRFVLCPKGVDEFFDRDNFIDPVSVLAREGKSVFQLPLFGAQEGETDTVRAVFRITGLDTVVRTPEWFFFPLLTSSMKALRSARPGIPTGLLITTRSSSLAST